MKFRIVDRPSRRGDIYRGPDGKWRVHPSGRVVETPPHDPADKPVGLPGPRGRDGKDSTVPGPAGKDAEPGIVWKGRWRRGQYAPGNAVTHEGSSYVATVVTRAEPPGHGWSVLAAKGDDGERITEYFTRVVRTVVTETGESVEASPQVQAVFDSAALIGFAVYVSSSGHVDNAQADDISTSGVIGLCVADVEAGNASVFQTEGTIHRDDWTAVVGTASLSSGALYFLDKTTPGHISTTAPEDGGECVVSVGRAIDANTLDIEIAPPILLAEEPEE
jgi:hypothetical protein